MRLSYSWGALPPTPPGPWTEGAGRRRSSFWPGQYRQGSLVLPDRRGWGEPVALVCDCPLVWAGFVLVGLVRGDARTSLFRCAKSRPAPSVLVRGVWGVEPPSGAR